MPQYQAYYERLVVHLSVWSVVRKRPASEDEEIASPSVGVITVVDKSGMTFCHRSCLASLAKQFPCGWLYFTWWKSFSIQTGVARKTQDMSCRTRYLPHNLPRKEIKVVSLLWWSSRTVTTITSVVYYLPSRCIHYVLQGDFNPDILLSACLHKPH